MGDVLIAGTIAPARENPWHISRRRLQPTDPVIQPEPCGSCSFVHSSHHRRYHRYLRPTRKEFAEQRFVEFSGTIAPPKKETPFMNELFPWLPEWANLNILVPVAATIVVIFVGCVVICVAFARRSRGPEQKRLRGTPVNPRKPGLKKEKKL